jgi:hypothetical protein
MQKPIAIIAITGAITPRELAIWRSQNLLRAGTNHALPKAGELNHIHHG